ncbi:apolipoprotein C-I [Sebastes umbrosus]|uniref:apolipoprotein C-I n=1 Tax=Sebastes umbrosus TaxID=72105 RepID=UPI00189E3F95|nr:apolipoprotein C-I [Sebastes umbrosus]
MRLYLAVAMLMLAFVAYTEAQDAEPTVEERFSQFGQKMTEMGQTVAEKARAAMDTVQNSEFAKKTNDWFTEQFNRMKAKMEEISQ